MIKIISYRVYNKTNYLIDDNKLIELNDSALMHNDHLKKFKIKLYEDNRIGNPIIEFIILNSEYEYKKLKYENYDRELFENIRLRFIDIY